MEREIKDVLYKMTDNNSPHWKKETMKEAYKELDEVYRKVEAFDRVKKEIRKNASYLFTKTPSEKRNAQIDILNGILITMDDAEFDAENKEGDQ